MNERDKDIVDIRKERDDLALLLRRLIHATILFREVAQAPGRKTKLFDVLPMTGARLGTVKWFSHWRKYCFFPDMETLFDPDCLFTIAEFCERQTKLHKGGDE